jgi:hypothetical protein
MIVPPSKNGAGINTGRAQRFQPAGGAAAAERAARSTLPAPGEPVDLAVAARQRPA